MVISNQFTSHYQRPPHRSQPWVCCATIPPPLRIIGITYLSHTSRAENSELVEFRSRAVLSCLRRITDTFLVLDISISHHVDQFDRKLRINSYHKNIEQDVIFYFSTYFIEKLTVYIIFKKGFPPTEGCQVRRLISGMRIRGRELHAITESVWPSTIM